VKECEYWSIHQNTAEYEESKTQKSAYQITKGPKKWRLTQLWKFFEDLWNVSQLSISIITLKMATPRLTQYC